MKLIFLITPRGQVYKLLSCVSMFAVEHQDKLSIIKSNYLQQFCSSNEIQKDVNKLFKNILPEAKFFKKYLRLSEELCINICSALENAAM